MSSHNIKQAIINTMAKIAQGETVSVPDEVITAYGGIEPLLERALQWFLSTEQTKVTRSLSRANRRDPGQLFLFGIENPALPTMVFVKDSKTKEQKIVPMEEATFSQLERQVKRDRQDVNFEDSRVMAKEKTIEFLKEHGVAADWTGARIKATFAPPETNE